MVVMALEGFKVEDMSKNTRVVIVDLMMSRPVGIL